MAIVADSLQCSAKNRCRTCTRVSALIIARHPLKIVGSWETDRRNDQAGHTGYNEESGGRCWSDSLRHTGNARVNAKAAAGTLLVAVIADLDSHEGILPGEEIDAEP